MSEINYVEKVKELISREPLPAPKFTLNPEIKDFYKFTRDDVHLEGYETHEQIKDIEVAKQVMKNKLKNIYHARIQYPEMLK